MAAISRNRTTPPHPWFGGSTRLHGCLDLHRSERSFAGDRQGCTRPQTISISPEVGSVGISQRSEIWPAYRISQKPFRAYAGGYVAMSRYNPRQRIPILAALVVLLDETAFRVGNRPYARQNKTYGATTLLKTHLRIADGTIELRYAAKGGKRVCHRLKHPRLQKILEKVADLPGRQLFKRQDETGELRSVDFWKPERLSCGNCRTIRFC